MATPIGEDGGDVPWTGDGGLGFSQGLDRLRATLATNDAMAPVRSLIKAVQLRQLVQAGRLLDAGAPVGMNRNHALLEAIQARSLPLVSRLLDAGADPLDNGGTPLREAATWGQRLVLKRMLAHLDTQERVLPPALGCSMLHHAAGKGFLEVVQMLVNRGVDLCVGSYPLGSPLEAAAQHGRERVVHWLLHRSGLPVTLDLLDRALAVTPASVPTLLMELSGLREVVAEREVLHEVARTAESAVLGVASGHVEPVMDQDPMGPTSGSSMGHASCSRRRL